MLTLLFIICLFTVFGKIIGLALRGAWGLTRVLFSIILFPFMLIGMAVGGLMKIAFPLLIVFGIVVFLRSMKAE